jgi:hypothetical protein
MTKLPSQYRHLQKTLSKTGLIAPGNVFPRYYTIKVAGKNKRCGPYYCWTTKQNQKTVTLALSSDQYRILKKAISDQKKLQATLKRMHKFTLNHVLYSTKGVDKRKRTFTSKTLTSRHSCQFA